MIEVAASILSADFAHLGERSLDVFARAGAHGITVRAETAFPLRPLLAAVRAKDLHAGVAINPRHTDRIGRCSAGRNTQMRIGMIRLGRMGRTMTLRSLAAGHEVVTYARRRETLEPFVRQGAFVSLEASPLLAHDTARTIDEAPAVEPRRAREPEGSWKP